MNDYEDPPDLDDAIAEDMTEIESDIRYAESAPIGGHVVNWRTLNDQDACAEWEALRGWVEWFALRYRISESVVPPCWFRHGHLVEELAALHAAHTAAFHPSDTGFGPIGFHERLSLAIPRLSRAYSGGCSRGHDSFKPRSWNTDAKQWDAWTSQAHAH